MTIAFIGKFELLHDEEYIARSFEELGHIVIRLPVTMNVGEMHRKLLKMQYDFVLFNKWEPHTVIKDILKTKKKVCWLFDLYWGYDREPRLKTAWYFKADNVFTTDGGDHPWDKINIKHDCVRQGIYSKECFLFPFKDASGVMFVGSNNPLYQQRTLMLQQLRKDYQFRWFGSTNTDELRGVILNEIYAHTKIVVGDSFYSPNYWSNRVVETLGRGGFLIHREVPGLKEEYPDIVTYNGTYEDLKEKIDYYMEHEEERREIILKNFNHVKNNYTMDKKCAELISKL